MNNTNDPMVPPVISEFRAPTPRQEEAFTPIEGYAGLVDSLLRNPRRVVWQIQTGNPAEAMLRLAGTGLAGALAYGLVVGTFAGGSQLWIAPVKIAGGLVAAGLICFPSLHIFASLSGSRARPAEMAALACGFLALTATLLVGFAPVAWIFSASTQSAVFVGGLHLAFWLVCLTFGLRFLDAGLSVFGSRAGAGVRVWGAIFLLVSLQTTCALRPILGGGDRFLPGEKKFFLQYWLQSLSE